MMKELGQDKIYSSIIKKLSDPIREAKLKILLVSSIFLSSLYIFFSIVTYVLAGRFFPNPNRDHILYPLVIITFLISAIVMFYFLKKKYYNAKLYYFLSFFVFFLVSGVFFTLPYTINNIPLSLLIDFFLTFMISWIFAFVITPYFSLLVSFVVLFNLVYVLNKVGLNFEYDNYWQFPSTKNMKLYSIMFFNYSLLGIFLILVSSNVVEEIKKAIKSSVEKLKVAQKEKIESETEMMRLTHELDALSLIQKRITPLFSKDSFFDCGFVSSVKCCYSHQNGSFSDFFCSENRKIFSILDFQGSSFENLSTMLMAHSVISYHFSKSGGKNLSNFSENVISILNKVAYENNFKRIQKSIHSSIVLADFTRDVNYVDIFGYGGGGFISFNSHKKIMKFIKINTDGFVGVSEALYEQPFYKRISMDSGDMLILVSQSLCDFLENNLGEDFENEIFYDKKDTDVITNKLIDYCIEFTKKNDYAIASFIKN